MSFKYDLFTSPPKAGKENLSIHARHTPHYILNIRKLAIIYSKKYIYVLKTN